MNIHHRTSTRPTIAAAGLALALLAGVAQAETLTVSHGFSSPSQITNFSYTGQLSFFDGALGTLTGALLTLEGGMDSVLTLGNIGGTSGQPMAGVSVLMGFSSTQPQLGSLLDGHDDIRLSLSTGRQTLAPGASYTASTTAALSQTSTRLDLQDMLPALSVVGGGSFGLTCDTSAGMQVSSGGAILAVSHSTAGFCGASIRYSYQAPSAAVPEPGALVLMALGLAGLGARRRWMA